MSAGFGDDGQVIKERVVREAVVAGPQALVHYLFTVVIAVAALAAARCAVAAAFVGGVAHGAVVFLLSAHGGGDEFALAVDDTAANPDLDTYAAVGCVGLGESIVDIGTEGVEGSAALFVMLGARHFSATDTARDGDLDTIGADAHGGRDSVLDGAAILYAAFNLLGDVLRHEDGVEFGAFHLGDVDLDVLVGEFLELFFEFVDLGASLTDDKARTGGVDGDRQKLKGSLDVDFGDASLSETDIEILTDFVVLDEFLLEATSAIPVRVPSADDT